MTREIEDVERWIEQVQYACIFSDGGICSDESKNKMARV